jgi:hypothetical protein
MQIMSFFGVCMTTIGKASPLSNGSRNGLRQTAVKDGHQEKAS